MIKIFKGEKMSNLVERALNGEVIAAARLMRLSDDRREGYQVFMKEIWKKTGHAHIIGITGAPGSGKSTLTDQLITKFRADGKTVGVVAIDPTSPFTGGAILGDRIRMATHSLDEGVFIRSVGTRGNLGGLSVSTMDIVAIMDAMGKDIVIIETVGVGQDEVEIAMVADTCIVVTVPGLGDDIQAIKAGIFEIADIFVVNKSDRDGAERTSNDLKMMLEITPKRDEWTVEVLKTMAEKGEGVDELIERINIHEDFFKENKLKRRKLNERLVHVAYGAVKEKLINDIFPPSKVKALIEEGNDPYSTVEILWKNIK